MWIFVVLFVEESGPKKRGRQLSKAEIQAAMGAADSTGNSSRGKGVKAANAGIDSVKAALAAVTGAINPQKVIFLSYQCLWLGWWRTSVACFWFQEGDRKKIQLEVIDNH